MDDDVREALDELREENARLKRALESGSRRDQTRAREEVASAREDLEDVLRREGYRFSRKDLDRIAQEMDDKRLDDRVEQKLREMGIVKPDEKDDDDKDDDDKDDKNDKKKGDDDEEWT